VVVAVVMVRTRCAGFALEAVSWACVLLLLAFFSPSFPCGGPLPNREKARRLNGGDSTAIVA
jgi:hypothetical protein